MKEIISVIGTYEFNLSPTLGAFSSAYVTMKFDPPQAGEEDKTMFVQLLSNKSNLEHNILSNHFVAKVEAGNPSPDNPLHTIIIGPGIAFDYTSPQNSSGRPLAVVTIPLPLPPRPSLRFIPSDNSNWMVEIEVDYIR